MKPLKVFGIIIGVFVWIGIGIVVYKFTSGSPETFVYEGKEVPERFLKTIKSLGLLQPGEELKYFYSDAIFDIKEGMYCVTDRNIALYSNDWEAQKAIVPFEKVVKVEVEYNPSFFEDSYVTVHTEDFVHFFPLSSDKGRDKKCIEYILSKTPEIPGQEPREEFLEKIFNKNPLTPEPDLDPDPEE